MKAISIEPSHAAGKISINSDDLIASHGVVKKLRQYRAEIQHLTCHEATIEAPVNTLVQMMAAMHMRRALGELTSAEFFLWVSATTGIISMVKNLVALETYGKAHMKSGNFQYVVGGCQDLPTLLSVAIFRLLEITSRLFTLLVAYEMLIAEYDTVWMHCAPPVYLACVSLVLLGFGMMDQPRSSKHLVLCFPACFVFPGPLVLSPQAKNACTSAVTHFFIRVLETLALATLICWLVNFDVQKAEKHFDRALIFTGACVVVLFIPSTIALLTVMHRRDHAGSKLLFGKELIKSGATAWPSEDISAAVAPYGFKQPQQFSDAGRSSISELNLKHETPDGCKALFSNLSPTVEGLSLSHLDEAKAIVIGAVIARFASVKKVDLAKKTVI
jgi:hypothetical protein